ncbi:MAG: alpha/beta hydrolase [Chloroflexota bacterium]
MPLERIELPFFCVMEKGIQYGEADGIPLLLDLVYPTETPSMPTPDHMPAVIDVHGGGWELGERGIGRGLMLALNGFFFASIDYRLTNVATFPAQIHDVKAAIRWLRAHAEDYNVDPNRIGLTGGSAGGHLISLAGVTGDMPELEGNSGWAGYSSRVQAVAAVNPVTDFRVSADEYPWLHTAEAVTKLFGNHMSAIPDLVSLASPIAHVTSDAPPFLIIHGTHDEIVVYTQAQHLYDALVDVNVPVTLVSYEGSGHALTGYAVQNWEHIMAFFKRVLGQAKNYGDPSKVAIKQSN